ncbi:MAG: leucine-rich repeat domain-containing protein [Treponemataceae bacterium]
MKKFKTVLFTNVIFIVSSIILFTGCPNSSNPTVVATKDFSKKIIITVHGGAHAKLAKNNSFIVNENSKWKEIKTFADTKVLFDGGYNDAGWQMTDFQGNEITWETEFSENATIYVTAKEIKKAKYTVLHYQKKLNEDEYVLTCTDIKSGAIDSLTAAQEKTYPGFELVPIEQEPIKKDGSTVIKVFYDRKTIAINLELNGGTGGTSFPADNKIEGIFGDILPEVPEPEQSTLVFDRWEPEMPKNFPANDITVTAQWRQARITIIGDDRISKDSEHYIDVAKNTVWNATKGAAETKAMDSLEEEWKSATTPYGLHKWHLNTEQGEIIGDDYVFTKDTTLYVTTNYAKFKIEGTKLSGFNSFHPRGRVFIPENVTSIEARVFENCQDLTVVDLSSCTVLKKIHHLAFENCNKITELDFLNCKELEEIEYQAFDNCSNLRNVNFYDCEKLTIIGDYSFSNCNKLKKIKIKKKEPATLKEALLNCKSGLNPKQILEVE